MSQSSGKNDSVKAKIERTAKGVKCMGLKSGSSQPSSVSKKAPGKTKTRYPARKTYMSKVQNKEPTNVFLCEDVADEEEINVEDSPVKSPPDVVPDVETSVSQEISDQENSRKESTSLEDSGKVTKPDISVSSSSKDADPKNGNSEDTNSAEPTQAPSPVQDISDDDVPLVKSILDSVAARMKRKRMVSTPEVTPTPPKRSKSSPEVSKALQEIIRMSTARKLKVDALLLKLQEEERQRGEQSAATTGAQDESNEEEEGSEESAEESGEESSSED
ncbi:protein gar2-like [Lotus japonicus]|uniref:protein gar2-like n=1 Tax=Lotus japonicus TaxID=34305 RepID=UPI002583EF44|nr:protein gar2-like [Lotus japonicus]